MKVIKVSLYICAILTQIFLLATPAMANNTSYTSYEEAVFQYFLIYDANGSDNAPALQQNTTNIFYISNEIPTKAGNKFVGWAASPDSIQAEYQPGEIFIADTALTILYAVWQSDQPKPAQTFTLLYDANGGEQPPAPQTNQSTEIFCHFQISSAKPVRAGYIFLGWSASPAGLLAEFTAGDEFWASSNQTILYAVWQQDNPQPLEHRYMLIYDANGGSLAAEPQIEYDFDFFHVFTIINAEPIRPGWDFLGWHTEPSALNAKFQPNDVFLALNEQNILYAVWRQQEQEQQPEPELIEYTLHYNANGGFNTPAEQKATGTKTNCLFTVSETIPLRTGYNFLGWSLDDSATQPDCQPGSSLITTENQSTLYAVWQKLPDEPSYTYLKELLGANAIRIKCANQAAGHLICSYELKENTYSFNLNQNNLTASLNIQPEAYLADYNANINGHKLLANSSSKEQLINLLYDEESAAWLTKPDYDNITFIINCPAPAQPAYSELAQFAVPVWLECINSTKTEHYPIGLNLEQTGLQIGPSIPCPDNTYSCLLTFQAQPYIEKYKVSYGPHKLISEAESEQRIQLYYKTSTQTWQAENLTFPCFKLVCSEPETPAPVYQYKLCFNANGGAEAPYPQMAVSDSESYVFFIPLEQPKRNNYTFIGWAAKAEENQAGYQPEQKILLHKEAPELTLYAVWQKNETNLPNPDISEPLPEKPLETAYCLYYNSNGGFDTPAEQVCYSTSEKYQFEITAEQPKRSGYTFIGWALTPTSENADYQAGNQIILTQKQPRLTLYAIWKVGQAENPPSYSTGGGGVYKPQPIPEEKIQPPTSQQVPHSAYINGYADGTIRPNAYLSRAEAAVMLYRLLNQNDEKAETTGEINWYDDEINFLMQTGLLQGYQDGRIRADAHLTRAELATLVIRIHNLQTSDFSGPAINPASKAFSDIAEHWAANYINQAAALGLLHGYPDGCFRPNQPITRAETVTLLNVLFGRAACAENFANHDNLSNWPDNLPGSWYYSNMQEAGCEHTYTINPDVSIILTQP